MSSVSGRTTTAPWRGLRRSQLHPCRYSIQHGSRCDGSTDCREWHGLSKLFNRSSLDSLSPLSPIPGQITGKLGLPLPRQHKGNQMAGIGGMGYDIRMDGQHFTLKNEIARLLRG